MNAIDTSVSHLQWLFTIIMALAITEGLKQFVRDLKDQDDHAKRPFRWACFCGLIAFLLTVMPFTYGMTRYFFEAYRRNPLDEGYFHHLFFDTLAFTLEALMFFVMSRTLSPARSLTFAWAALIVYSVDIVWVLKCKFFDVPSGVRLETWWIVQDPCVVGLLLVGILLHNRKTLGATGLYRVVCAVLILETIVDLPLNWSFYFPSKGPPPYPTPS